MKIKCFLAISLLLLAGRCHEGHTEDDAGELQTGESAEGQVIEVGGDAVEDDLGDDQNLEPKKLNDSQFCESKQRTVCQLRPSKIEAFVEGQDCALLMVVPNPSAAQLKLFRQVIKRLEGIPGNCPTAWVDTTLDAEYVAQTDYFPKSLFVLFNKDTPQEYKGKMSALAIFRWAVKSSFDIVHSIQGVDELGSFRDLKSYGILINPRKDTGLSSAFRDFAKHVLDLNFLESTSMAIAEHFETDDKPRFVLATDSLNQTHKLELSDDKLDRKALLDFLNKHRRLDLITGEKPNFNQLLAWKEIAVIHVGSEDSDQARFRDFARRFNGVDNPDEDPAHKEELDRLFPKGFVVEGAWTNFVEAKAKTGLGGWLAHNVGRSENETGDWIIIVRQETDELEKFYFPTWTPEALKDAILKLDQGQLQQTYRGEAVAEENNLPVRGLTRDTLTKEVIEHPRAALVLVYSPSCGFCVEKREIFKKIAIEFEGVEDFGVFEIDGVKNDHPSFYVDSYPKAYFYQGPNKMDPESLQFEGFGQLEEFLEGKGIVSNKKKLAGEL